MLLDKEFEKMRRDFIASCEHDRAEHKSFEIVSEDADLLSYHASRLGYDHQVNDKGASKEIVFVGKTRDWGPVWQAFYSAKARAFYSAGGRATITSDNIRSLQIFAYLAQSDRGNSIVCPYAVELLLGLVQAGSGDFEQGKRIRSVVPRRSLSQSVSSDIVRSGVAYAFGGNEKETYRQEVKERYPDVEELPLDAKEFNAWVSRKTMVNGEPLIEKIVPETNPFVTTILAAYALFKGKWKHEFKDFGNRPFSEVSGDKTPGKSLAPFMTVSGIRTFAAKDCQVAGIICDQVMIPYKAGEDGEESSYKMHIIQPKGLLSNVNDVLMSLDRGYWWDIFNCLKVHDKVDVTMPKWRNESGIDDLLPLFRHLDLDLDVQGNMPWIDAQAMVSTAMHKAVIEVDEKGTVAAGAAAAMITRSLVSPSISFNIDSPFVYLIMGPDEQIYFAGVYRRP